MSRDPVTRDIAVVAYEESRLEQPEGTGENVIALHCDRERSYLTVLWGRRLILYRDVDFAESKAIERLAEVLELTPEAAATLLERYGLDRTQAAPEGSEADKVDAGDIAAAVSEILRPSFDPVVEQVRKAVVYTESRTRGESVDRVLLCGTLARWPGVEKLLAAILPVPVKVMDPLAKLAPTDPGRPPIGLEVAAGLALRGICDA